MMAGVIAGSPLRAASEMSLGRLRRRATFEKACLDAPYGQAVSGR